MPSWAGHVCKSPRADPTRWLSPSGGARDQGQPDYVLANSITGHEAERRPGTREEWLAVTKHDGVEVDPQSRRLRSSLSIRNQMRLLEQFADFGGVELLHQQFAQQVWPGD